MSGSNCETGTCSFQTSAFNPASSAPLPDSLIVPSEAVVPTQNDLPSSDASRPSSSPAAATLLDPSTFFPPSPGSLPGPTIVIEFCDRCRWLHRACWVQTELFLTFPPPNIKAITLVPLNTEETGGRFRVWLFSEKNAKPELMWDRKIEGGFPELKLLKQRIRNMIAPSTSLGHSDKTSGRAEA